MIGRRCPLLLTVVLSVLALPSARANPAYVTPGSFYFSTGLGQKSIDILSEGDIRPNARPFVFAGVEAGYMLADNCGLSAAGQLGGAFFDFNDPGTSGKVEEVLWSARAGLDWVRPHEGGRIAYAGASYEYAEAKSWLENRLISETGPRNVLSGVSVRGGIGWRLTSWLLITGELQGSAFRGRADVSSTRARYNWFGRALGVAIGLRFASNTGQVSPQ